ncbi:MAG: ATP-grasp domain-containing protein [Pseudomonadota bacterium]
MSNVLVTGTGAIIGYGILKSIKKGMPDVRCVAADIHSDAVGQHWADKFVQAPYTSDENYKGWLCEVIERHSIDLVIPGIEQDVFFLAEAVQDNESFPAKLAINNPDLIQIAIDKLKLDQMLVRDGISCRIETMSQGSFEELADCLGLPFLMKPRRGYASKGIVTIEKKEDFQPLEKQMGSFFIAQAYTGSDDEEYTVSAFCNNSGEIRSSIALRRKLATDGSTAKGSLVDISQFQPVLEELCEAFSPNGPTNFQFRLVEGGPKLLEINPRISSSTSIRTALGMNEACMCIDHYLNNKTINQAELRSGHAVRFIDDMVTYK